MVLLHMGKFCLCVQVVVLLRNLRYSLLDTSSQYQNERAIGDYFKTNSRNNVFITTKVWPTDLGFEETLQSFEESLFDLRTSYVSAHFLQDLSSIVFRR